MKIFSAVNLIGKAISRGMAPKQSRMLQIPLDFADVTAAGAIAVSLDMSDTTNNKWGISGIQSVLIDNSANAFITVFNFDNGYAVTVPAYSMGIYPVFFSGIGLNFVAASVGNVVVTATFINTREQAQVWATQIPIAGAVNVSGSTVFVQPVAANVTDRSKTLTGAGASEVLMAANANRKRLIIQNRSTPAGQGGIAGVEYAFFNFGGAAVVNGVGSFELYPGASYDTAGGPCPTDAINWSAATAGHYLVAKEL